MWQQVSKQLFLIFVLLSLGSTALATTGQDEVQCSAPEEYLREIGKLNSSHQESLDYSCFASLQSININESLVVDVRHSRDFAKAFVPGSINKSSSALSNLSHLRNKKLLVVGYPDAYSELARVCHDLKTSGFSDVAILKGGIFTMAKLAGKVSGDPSYIDTLHIADSRRAARELLHGTAHLILQGTGNEMSDRIKNLVPNLDFYQDSAQFIPLVQKALHSGEAIAPLIFTASRISNPDERISGLVELESVEELVTELIKLSKAKVQYGSIPNRYKCKG